MFDIKILGYSFYHEYNDKAYPIVKIEARHEDEFLCMPIEFERVYDAYDWVYNRLDCTLDDMIKNFVDELWKEFHKGIPKVYEISLYISLPVGLNMCIKEHIRNEFEKRLAMKREEDEICRKLSNSRLDIASMYPVPNRDICTHLADSIIDTLRYAQYDMNNYVANYVAKAKEKIKEYEKMKIEDVIFNDPATIVFWRDGSKTVVKAQDGEPYDPEKGLAMAIAKKVYGNEGNYYNEFKKFIKDEPKEDNKN